MLSCNDTIEDIQRDFEIVWMENDSVTHEERPGDLATSYAGKSGERAR